MSGRRRKTRIINPTTWDADALSDIALDLGLEITEEQVTHFMEEHADEIEQVATDAAMDEIRALLSERFGTSSVDAPTPPMPAVSQRGEQATTMKQILWPVSWAGDQGWPTKDSGPEWAARDRVLREEHGTSLDAVVAELEGPAPSTDAETPPLAINAHSRSRPA